MVLASFETALCNNASVAWVWEKESEGGGKGIGKRRKEIMKAIRSHNINKEIRLERQRMV